MTHSEWHNDGLKSAYYFINMAMGEILDPSFNLLMEQYRNALDAIVRADEGLRIKDTEINRLKKEIADQIMEK